MRIDRLSLVRYGHFHDHTIDFGPSAEGIDLHIVYGDNEAGKSTSYHALLDLLFGIKSKSPPYAFRYARKELRVDATLSGPGHTLALTRTGKGLLDEHGALLDEMVLGPWLQSLDRQQYSAMFSMDEDSLEQGGRDIIASKGNLGQTLFAAGSGLGDLHARLQTLLDERAGYYLGPGKRTDWPLFRQLARVKELGEDLKRLDVRADAWQRLKQDVKTCDEAFVKADEACKRAVEQGHRLERSIGWQQRAVALLGEERDLQALPTLPAVEPHWWEDLDDVVTRARCAGEKREQLQRTLGELDKTLAEPRSSDDLLDAADTVQALRTQAVALSTEGRRLDGQRAERDAAEMEAAALSLQLDIPTSAGDTAAASMADPLLDAERRNRCRSLLQARGALVEAERQALAESEAAARQLAALDEPPDAEPPDPCALERAVRDIESDDRLRAPTELQQLRHDAMDTLEHDLARLAPWRGDTDALADIDAPRPSDLKRLADRRADVLREHERDTRAVEELCKEIADLSHDLADRPEVPDDRHRDEVLHEQWVRWATHRDALAACAPAERLLDTAGRFETTLREAERLALRRDAEREARAAQRIGRQRLEGLRKRHARSASSCAGSQQRLGDQDAAIDTVAVHLGLPTGSTVDELLAWLERRDTALKSARTLAGHERRMAERVTARSEQGARLVGLLQACGAERDTDEHASLEHRLAQARERIALLQASRSAWSESRRVRGEAGSNVRDRDRALVTARRALADWQADWQAVTQGTALAERAVDDAEQRLGRLERLAQASRVRHRHDSEVQRHETERQQHRATIETLGTRLAPFIDTTRSDTLAALHAALESARADAKRHEEANEARARAIEALKSLEHEHGTVLHETERRCRLLDVDSLDAMASCVRTHRERTQLRARLDRESAALLVEASDTQGTTTTIAALAAADPSALLAEQDRLRALVSESGKARDDARDALSSARGAVNSIGADNAVALLEERRGSLLLDIRESVHAALAVRLGVAAAHEGMRRWRSTHRSDMLSDASDTFARLTDGHFRALVAEPAAGGEDHLYAVAADGSMKLSDQLSKGTRFQLYLALRVAAHRRWCRQHAPPPFVADDVLETFDDTRTASTFEAFTEMARHGQVIYLTHHRHVVDIARAASKGMVRVHELPARR